MQRIYNELEQMEQKLGETGKESELEYRGGGGRTENDQKSKEKRTES